MEYVTVSEVDELLGQSWAAEDKKARAVLLANAWMSEQRLPNLDPMPRQWKQAAAEVAAEAALGRLYRATEIGVTSKSVKGDTVESSKSFASNYQQLTAGERFALALLKPWKSQGGVIFLKRA